jgi:hypothetical protein
VAGGRRGSLTLQRGRAGQAAALGCLVFSLFLLIAGGERPARAGESESRSSLASEYLRLLTENAALTARLSLTKDPDSYLVADLSARRLELELQGVTLTSLPIEEVRLNPHALRLLAAGDRAKFLETPFVLGDDRWFDTAKTLALKDSSAVRSKADTTGALMQAIRTTSVTAMLTYDRRLTIVLDGQAPQTGWERFKARITAWLQSWSSGTVEGILRRQSADEVMITLRMSPADVRSLAPTLTEGTKLVLVF